MNKFIITIVIFWVIAKAVQATIEELKQRMEGMQSGREKDVPPRRTASSPGRTATARNTARWEAGQPRPGAEKDELEQWLEEALERKRQLKKTGGTVRVEAEEYSLPGELRPETPRRPVSGPRRPPVERPRRARQKQRQVVQPRPKTAARPEKEQLKPALVAREPKEAAEKRRHRGRERKTLAGLGRLNKNDIRRGIIMAEILGAPKALRDIDSHII